MFVVFVVTSPLKDYPETPRETVPVSQKSITLIPSYACERKPVKQRF